MSEADDHSEKSESTSDDGALIPKMNSSGDGLTEFVGDAVEQNDVQAPAKIFSIGDPETRLLASANESRDPGGKDPNFGFTNANFLKHFRIERALGKGGMGEVYLATDTRLNRQVAVKRIRVERASSNTAVSRFQNEAKTLARFNHPNLVQIFEYGEDDSGPYLVMEHVDGTTLQDRCNSGPMDEIEAVELICHLCEGLALVHAEGKLHRDIKPANILLTKNGIPKLSDFGLAKQHALQASHSIEGAVIGTYGFMSPEQENGKEVDARSDQWSLAATLYQMLTGESPRKINISKVSQSLRSVIDKALEERPENRFGSIVEFREALEKSSNSLYDLAIELNDGQCVICKTRNRADRKFCDRCGTTLLAKGIGCGHEVRVWDARCGECGQEQAPLLEKVRFEKVEDQRRAEALADSFDYAEAIEIAERMKSDDDIRFDHFKTWAERFLIETEGKRASMQVEIEKGICQALDLEAVFEDAAALEVLEEIPTKFRDQTVSISDQTLTTNKLSGRIQDRLSEVTRLESEFHRLDSEFSEIPESEHGQLVPLGFFPDAMKNLSLVFQLVALADRLMALRPNHELLHELRKFDEILQRMPEFVEENAKELLEHQHYKECLDLFETIESAGSNWSLLSPSSLAIRTQSKQLQQRVDFLRESIREQLDAGQYDDQLVSSLDECCQLQKFDTQLAELGATARSKVVKKRVQENANKLLANKQFRECIELLDGTRMDDLPEDSADLRSAAMVKLNRIQELKKQVLSCENTAVVSSQNEASIVRNKTSPLLLELFDLDRELKLIMEIARQHLPAFRPDLAKETMIPPTVAAEHVASSPNSTIPKNTISSQKIFPLKQRAGFTIKFEGSGNEYELIYSSCTLCLFILTTLLIATADYWFPPLIQSITRWTACIGLFLSLSLAMLQSYRCRKFEELNEELLIFLFCLTALEYLCSSFAAVPSSIVINILVFSVYACAVVTLSIALLLNKSHRRILEFSAISGFTLLYFINSTWTGMISFGVNSLILSSAILYLKSSESFRDSKLRPVLQFVTTGLTVVLFPLSIGPVSWAIYSCTVLLAASQAEKSKRWSKYLLIYSLGLLTLWFINEPGRNSILRNASYAWEFIQKSVGPPAKRVSNDVSHLKQ